MYVTDEARFECLSVRDGLSNNFVTAIHQDAQGFLWVGTRDGLNKFDGYTFTVSQPGSPEPDNKPGYTHITNIHKDRNGLFWVSTLNKGLRRFDPQTARTIDYHNRATGNKPIQTDFGIFADQEDVFWIPALNGLNRFNPQTGDVTFYPFRGNFEWVSSVCKDNSGQLWLGTRHGLYRFDERSGQFTLFRLKPPQPSVHSSIPHLIESVYKDAAGTLWVGVFQIGLYRLNPITQQIIAFYPFKTKSLAGGHFYQNAMLEEGNMLWLGTDAGLQCINTQTGEVFTSPQRFSGPNRPGGNEVYALYKDRSGILWVGTNKGITKVEQHGLQFRTYQFMPDATNSRLPENNIEPAYIDRSGVIWLSNSPGPGGLYRFDAVQDKLTRYEARPTDPHGLIHNFITGDAILEDHTGILWVGAGETLHALDRQTGRFTRYPVGTFFWLIREDIFGKIWIDGNGISSLDRKTGKFTHYRHNPKDSTSLGDNGVGALLTSRTGDIWVGGMGISRLNQVTGKFTRYLPNLTHPAGHLNDLLISAFYEDSHGIIWIGTQHGGLNRFDPKTQLFTAFTTHDGLPSNQIRGMTGDSAGHLWLTTDRGLCRFNTTTKVCRNFDESDGLREDDFHFGSVQYRHGKLILHGHNGFSVFYPDSLRDNIPAPPVYITGFSVFDKPHPVDTRPIELGYQENFFSFEFAALSYRSVQKNQYAYQLEGVDPQWVYSGTRRSASYTDIAPGTYTFRVKGSNSDGVWSEKGTSVTLIIHPPWWRTWWFTALIVALVVSLIATGFHYRVEQIRREEVRKTKDVEQKAQFSKKLSEMEMQALRAQMNPHFIFNSLNSINRFIMKNEAEAASDYLSKFSKLIRLILQNSNAPGVTLENELNALQLYLELESLRFEKKFSFQIHCASGVELAYLEIPPLLIQPYVENAIWHGLMHKQGSGHIDISVACERDWLLCTVQDDGIGRQRAAELKSQSVTRNKSLGMTITAHRLALLNQGAERQTAVEVVDLVDSLGEPCGTRVQLKIPV
ncbi:two-component regulator propeller domain-containing protein [Nibrella saemangeumensis]|uniref:two-component regulator propeller domain-containing protein n=1 Tax=Nibrella saemangeumensis TaxID=1084526 RepID=UPI0031EFE8F8